MSFEQYVVWGAKNILFSFASEPLAATNHMPQATRRMGESGRPTWSGKVSRRVAVQQRTGGRTFPSRRGAKIYRKNNTIFYSALQKNPYLCKNKDGMTCNSHTSLVTNW